jgi:hypothetical protein
MGGEGGAGHSGWLVVFLCTGSEVTDRLSCFSLQGHGLSNLPWGEGTGDLAGEDLVGWKDNGADTQGDGAGYRGMG